MTERNYKNEITERIAGRQPKSLFIIPEGAKIAGVANGIATYFDINPKIVRGLFIFLALITKGAWAVAYLILVFIIPIAKTEEDRARAHGVILAQPELSRDLAPEYAHRR